MSTRHKIYCKVPEVGEKLTYLFDTNYGELFDEFRAKHGRNPLGEELKTIHEECLDVWKQATVIKVSPKGHRLTLQDEEGNISDLEYDMVDMWELSKGGRNEIKTNFGCLALRGWTMRLPARVSSIVQDRENGLRR